ncbi:MAG TPA: MoaD/ThiS family protein, partial [Chthonomonadaceae bacterium]|nr:MoaD/ThiS family protein [Chthonomonadaceae bacterium]
ETVTASPGTVATMVAELESQYPGISKSLTDEKGELRRFVNVYVNEEDIRFLDRENTVLNDGDAVSIVPAIAGG